jgi:hypothetical protein
MSQKKSRGGGGAGDDSEDLTRPPPLQAVLLADSFTQKFRPITLERPKVPRPGNPARLTHPRSRARCPPAEFLFVAGAAPAGERAHDRVRADVAGDGGGGGGLRVLLLPRAPGQGVPGEGEVDREASGRDHGRVGSRIARRYQCGRCTTRHVRPRRGQFFFILIFNHACFLLQSIDDLKGS